MIVEDEPYTREQMEKALKKYPFLRGIRVFSADSGNKAMEFLTEQKFDLVLLDVVLPDVDGFFIARELNTRKIPFYMISSRDHPADAISGFRAGADEYLRKPVDNEELAVRVHHFLSMKKSPPRNTDPVFQLGKWRIDSNSGLVYIRGKNISLTPIEMRILLLLAENPGRYLSTETLVKAVWPKDPPSDGTLAIRVNIRRLRSKLEPDIRNPRHITNKWGAGYKLIPDEDSELQPEGEESRDY